MIDEDGTNERAITGKLPSADGPVWSPDGQKIAFIRARENPTSTDIYVMDADGTNETPLADDPASRNGAAWSPDGQKIAFLRSPTETPGQTPGLLADVYVIDEDGTNETRLFQNRPENETNPDLGWPVWSPDGNKIAFASHATDPNPPSSASAESTLSSNSPAAKMTGIYVIDVDTAGLCKLTSTGTSPTWSPDGNKIAFENAFAIYVINSDGSGQKELTNAVPTAVPELSPPAWAPDSERIAFAKKQTFT